MALVTAPSNVVEYSCDMCPLKTHSLGYLGNHKRFKHDEEGMVHRCDLCDRVFAYQSGVEAHKIQLHVQDGIILRCDSCEYVTNSKYSLRAHVKNNHASSYFCKRCNIRIDGVSKRQHDYRVHDSERMKQRIRMRRRSTLKCTKCQYKTDTDSRLDNHIRSKHSSRSLDCKLCKYKTPFEGRLELHIYNEHSLKSCDDCEFETNMKDKFEYHQHEAHKSLYSCVPCNFTTSSISYLKKHNNSSHGHKLDCIKSCSEQRSQTQLTNGRFILK